MMAGIFDNLRLPARRRGIFGSAAGGLGSGDSGEATALALINALGPMQQAGLERSASPVGAIAKNLIPLFGAIIQGQMLQKQSEQQAELLGLEKAKIQAETAKAQRGTLPTGIEQALVQAVQSGDTSKISELVKLKQQIQTPSKAQPNQWALALQAAGGDPQKALDIVLGQEEKLSKYKQGIKPPPKEASAEMTPKERRALALQIAKADIAGNSPQAWVQDAQGKNVRRKSIQERMAEVEQELQQQATPDAANSLKEKPKPADVGVKIPEGWKIEVSP